MARSHTGQGRPQKLPWAAIAAAALVLAIALAFLLPLPMPALSPSESICITYTCNDTAPVRRSITLAPGTPEHAAFTAAWQKYHLNLSSATLPKLLAGEWSVTGHSVSGSVSNGAGVILTVMDSGEAMTDDLVLRMGQKQAKRLLAEFEILTAQSPPAA